MKSIPVTFLIVFCVAIWEFGSTNPVAMSCDSCGAECSRACGTRHFRSCCFNYVRKRTLAFHPYSLNKLRYETLYRRLPYGENEDKTQSKIDQEQNPRKIFSPPFEGISHEDHREERTLKGFLKHRKDEHEVAAVDDYDESGRASDSAQQSGYET